MNLLNLPFINLKLFKNKVSTPSGNVGLRWIWLLSKVLFWLYGFRFYTFRLSNVMLWTFLMRVYIFFKISEDDFGAFWPKTRLEVYLLVDTRKTLSSTLKIVQYGFSLDFILKYVFIHIKNHQLRHLSVKSFYSCY